MHDPRSKRRDLRRAYLSGDGPRIRKLFEKENSICRKYLDLQFWNAYQQKEDEWMFHKLGISRLGGTGNAPAWFRRKLNKLQRVREKAALRSAYLRNEWNNFQLPRYHRNANWEWW